MASKVEQKEIFFVHFYNVDCWDDVQFLNPSLTSLRGEECMYDSSGLTIKTFCEVFLFVYKINFNLARAPMRIIPKTKGLL